jgi:hypothetical protein
MVSTVEYENLVARIDSDAGDMAKYKAIGENGPPVEDIIGAGLAR